MVRSPPRVSSAADSGGTGKRLGGDHCETAHPLRQGVWEESVADAEIKMKVPNDVTSDGPKVHAGLKGTLDKPTVASPGGVCSKLAKASCFRV